MIQKLRWKFVFTIMTVVTILLLVMFGMLYRFTQIQLEQESIAMMRSVIETNALWDCQMNCLGRCGCPILPFSLAWIGMWWIRWGATMICLTKPFWGNW